MAEPAADNFKLAKERAEKAGTHLNVTVFCMPSLIYPYKEQTGGRKAKGYLETTKLKFYYQKEQVNPSS